jgi:hypothetical protein
MSLNMNININLKSVVFPILKKHCSHIHILPWMHFFFFFTFQVSYQTLILDNLILVKDQ